MGPRNDGEFQAADLHTPEELLVGTEALLLSSDPQMMRVVVLETITDLEAFVHSTIFSILKEKLDPLLVKLTCPPRTGPVIMLEYGSKKRGN